MAKITCYQGLWLLAKEMDVESAAAKGGKQCSALVTVCNLETNQYFLASVVMIREVKDGALGSICKSVEDGDRMVHCW